MVNWSCSLAFCFKKYKTKDLNGEKIKGEKKKIQKFTYNTRSSFKPIYLIGMTDIYVLLTGLLGKEIPYVSDIPISEDQFDKIKQKHFLLQKML